MSLTNEDREALGDWWNEGGEFSNAIWDLSTLRPVVESILARHIATATAEARAAALNEAAEQIESANLGLCECGHDQGGEHNSRGCYGTVDYGLWTQRACDCRRTDDENPVSENAARIVRNLATTSPPARTRP